MKKQALLLMMLLIPHFSVDAKQQTVILEVPGMNCAVCPFTIRKALQQVDGVSNAEVSFKAKQAVVTFDDNKTKLATLITATTNAGYPSTLKQQNINE